MIGKNRAEGKKASPATGFGNSIRKLCHNVKISDIGGVMQADNLWRWQEHCYSNAYAALAFVVAGVGGRRDFGAGPNRYLPLFLVRTAYFWRNSHDAQP